MSALERMQTRDDLLCAADVLARRGWCRGYLHHPDEGPCCLIGAIRVAVGLEHLRDVDAPPYSQARLARALRVVRDRLALITGLSGAPTVLWNDAPERTGLEVDELLRATAESLL